MSLPLLLLSLFIINVHVHVLVFLLFIFIYYFYLTNKEAVYYTVIKHDGHLRTRGKYRKHELQASVFYISRVFSNDRSVLSQCNTQLRLPRFALIYRFYTRKTIKHAFSMFYTLIKHRFLTNQSARRVLSIIILILIYFYYFL